jgi:acyl-coenzyme A thioesterase PaaI-like protein
VSIHDEIAQARKEKRFDHIIERIPYAKLIGIECYPIGDEWIFKLPKKEDNEGNPFLPALHGGVIGGFMEMAATLYVMAKMETQSIPKVIDFAIDYLRPGQMTDTFVECDVVRQGRKIVNVSIHAWQTRRNEPTATARAHFLLV